MGARVLLIGLDSADPSLLTDWAASGELPVVGSLTAEGARGILRNPGWIADQGAWVSFVTATGPAKHGCYHHRQVFPGSYRSRWVRSDDVHGLPFWTRLSDSGRRVAIIDIPRGPLSVNLNGILLADWMVHPRLYSKVVSYPAELASQIIAKHGPDLTAAACEHHTEPIALPGMVDGLEQGIRSKTRLATDLLRRDEWDLVAVAFKEAHCVGHYFWHALDPQHPGYAAANRYGNPMLRVYRALDEAVGTLLQSVSPETTVIVFSTLGMGPHYTGNHLLDAILMRLEKQPNAISALRSAWRRIGEPWRIRLWAQLRPFAERLSDSSLGGRRAFAVEYNEMAGAVMINRVGRFPSGRVEPGAESDDLCDFLQAELASLVDADDGAPLVERVLRTRDVSDGPQADVLPDLMVVWRRQRPITSAASSRIGMVRGINNDPRSGNHFPEGILFARGPGIVPGSTLADMQIRDIGPTAAALLDCPLGLVDGRAVLTRNLRTAVSS